MVLVKNQDCFHDAWNEYAVFQKETKIKQHSAVDYTITWGYQEQHNLKFLTIDLQALIEI
jgi:hypothetical protein